MGVFAEFGGLQALLISLFGLFGWSINEKLMNAEFIKSLYFTKDSNKINNIFFGIKDKLSDFNFCCKLSKS